MREKPKIKAIIFDVGGVLALGKDLGQFKGSSSRGVHDKIAKSLGVSTDQWFDTIGEKYDKTITGELKEKDFLIYLSKTFHKSTDFLKNLFLKNYRKNYRQNTELYKFAFKLKKKGYTIAILSDQHPLSEQAVLPSSKTKLFNPVLISYKVHLRKPNPSIYTLMLKRLNLRPEQTLFIDNQTWNLIPATKLGMNAVLFRNNRLLFKQLKHLGVKIK